MKPHILIINASHTSYLVSTLKQINISESDAVILSVISKQDQKLLLEYKESDRLIILPRAGEYSFRFSVRNLWQILKSKYKQVLLLEVDSHASRQRRVEALLSLTLSPEKHIYYEDGSNILWQHKTEFKDYLAMIAAIADNFMFSILYIIEWSLTIIIRIIGKLALYLVKSTI